MRIYRSYCQSRRWEHLCIRFMAFLLLFSLSMVHARESTSINTRNDAAISKTLITLESFVNLRDNLQKDINVLSRQIQNAGSDAEKKVLEQELYKLEAEILATKRNFREIAAGIDISILREIEKQEFNFQEELLALIKPVFNEMKAMTSFVRQKSDLEQKIIYYEERLPVIEAALNNIRVLRRDSDNNEVVNSALDAVAVAWKQQLSYIQSELQATQLHLDELLASQTTFTEASKTYLKSFFHKRGLYLAEALLVVLGIILLSQLGYAAMQRFISGFRAEHRCFRVRLIELLHRVVTIFLVILGPLVVFYLGEDWVLFSLGILLLFGLIWALRQALPRYWHQFHLFLNIGSVREGERILIDGLPWKVQRINFFCKLINPMARISQRVPLNDLVDLKSRPFGAAEPWFPCKKVDWVILNDGVRGKVTGISPEMVEMVERGGARMTYLTSDFLARSPRNLAANFRIKETLGISYSLQQEATTMIPETLYRFIQQRASQEGYGDDLLNLRVEFEQAGNSSLDLVVIADFRGELGELYNRLRRAIQRWCVEACSEFGWEIPFPQLTVHGALAFVDEKKQ